MLRHAPSTASRSVVDTLRAGNIRSMSAAPSKFDGLCRASAEEILRGARPLALVLCGLGGLTAAPERVFDTGPGELLVQRVAGAIAGRRGGELQRCLEYLARAPPLLLDVQFAAKEICRWMFRPTEQALQGLKRVGRYLEGQPRVLYEYRWQTAEGLEVYSDTDWAGCARTRKSTSGGCLMVKRCFADGPALDTP